MTDIKRLCAETGTDYNTVLVERYKLLEAVHALTVCLNDEEDYEYFALNGIPDEPNEYDLLSIAEDEEAFDNVLSVFVNVIRGSDCASWSVFAL